MLLLRTGAVDYVEGGACRLVSRNRNAFKSFEQLAQAIADELAGRSAILDGEIVHPGPERGLDGRPMFYLLTLITKGVRPFVRFTGETSAYGCGPWGLHRLMAYATLAPRRSRVGDQIRGASTP